MAQALQRLVTMTVLKGNLNKTEIYAGAIFNRSDMFYAVNFDRFDMREDEMHINLTTPQEQEMPNIIPSAPRYDDAVQVDNTTMRSSPSHPPEPTCHDDAIPFDNTSNHPG